MTEELARLPRPHCPLADGLRCVPTGREGELEHGKGPRFPLTTSRGARRLSGREDVKPSTELNQLNFLGTLGAAPSVPF